MIWRDALQAVRVLRKNPTFTLVAVFTLALGIGANTAMFSVVHGVLLAPLQYPDADRIVSVNTVNSGKVTKRLTGGDLVDIRDTNGAFEAISPYFGGELGVQMRDHAEFTGTYFVNASFFRVLGMKPLFGRVFTDAEFERSAVVGRAFAERNFGAAQNAVGRTLSVEDRVYEITGVVDDAFAFPAKTEIWVPASYRPENLNRTAYNYTTIAKLKPAVSIDAAQADLGSIGARLARAYPDTNRNKTFSLTPLREQLVGKMRTTLYFLMGAVGLVLLIACANVAHLLLARAKARSREIAVRLALGASRRRIIRELTVENAVLALLGGAAGLLIAAMGIPALIRLSPENLPRMLEVHIDPFVLAFATAASLAASLLFGLAPAWQTTRVDLNDALKQGMSRGSVGARSHSLRNALVVTEIALSFVLAIGAGLLFRSLISLYEAPLGFRPEGLLIMYAHAPARDLPQYLQVGRMFQDAADQFANVPGVTASAVAMGLPAGQYGSHGSYAVEGKHVFAPGQKLPHADFSLSSPGYFAALGIPMVKGRDFSVRDDYQSPFVTIISAALARETFPNEDPLGRRIQCGLDSPKWMTIIGVVGDVRQDSPAASPGPTLYMPLRQHPFYGNEVQFIMRTRADAVALIPAIRTRMHRLDPQIAMKFTTMNAMLATSISTPRFRTFLAGAFAGLAVLLAMAGVYGVMTYATAQRTAELGLRMALGAGRSGILGMILGRAAFLAAIGLALGAVLSLALGRVAASMLFGIEPSDALTYVSAAAALSVATIGAAAIPAWRATRIDPLAALREE